MVNAAGFGKIGKVSECTTNTIQGMITLNCTALTKMTTLCLPYCGKRSHVIQIASAAAFVPQPGLAVYAATKSYVLSLSRALRREVKQEGITVTTVCPGPVDTEFFQKAGGSISFCEEVMYGKGGSGSTQGNPGRGGRKGIVCLWCTHECCVCAVQDHSSPGAACCYESDTIRERRTIFT